MAEPSSESTRRRPPGLARRVLLARLAIFWEDLLVRLWRAASVAALVLGLSLLGAWAWMPGLLHVLLLGALVAAALLLAWRDLRGLAWPGEAQALRRLELKSGFDHRPLLALDDDFAGDPADRGSRALFEAHRRRMADRLKALRVGRPLSRVPGADRYALRTLAGLVLAAGLIAGWGDARAQLRAALEPDFSRGLGEGAEVGEATLWITPPAYTGVPPIWLDVATAAAVDRPIAVPAGSELVVQVRGGDEIPEIVVDEARTAMAEAGAGSYQASRVLESGTRLAVAQSGRELAAWPIEIVPDTVPVVALTAPPEETLRTGLRVDVEARDDYGIESVVGRFTLVDRPEEPPLEVMVPISHAGITETAGPAFFSLMTHPWAGMEVVLQLTATDVVGQTGTSEAVTLELPERFFFHPVAREIAAARKELVRDAATAAAAAAMLLELAADPAAFLDDPTVYLAMIIGAQRLVFGDIAQTRDEVVDLMWDTAIAVEEGPLAFAEQRVKEIQERLAEALAEGADEQEIERLIDELREAMDDYMRALSDRLRSDPGELFDPTDALKAVGSRELTDLVEQLRDLVKTGSMGQAQTLLNRLQEIMENISVGNLSDLTGAISAEAAEVLHTIRELMAGEQELLDRTYRMLGESADGTFDSQEEHAAQLALQETLQGLMERMERFGFGVPREFERADRSMNRAARQLEDDRPGQAIDHQTAAIDQLRTGADTLMQQLIEQSGEESAGEGRNFLAAPRDPMGRALSGVGVEDVSNVELPERGALMKAREILDELYRRASEQHRSPDEQLYLQRLLRRF